MPGISSVVLTASDPAATDALLTAWGIADRIGTRAGDVSPEGFRGYTLSLVVSQPSTVDSLVQLALDNGATEVKPVAKSFWGYGGAIAAPDGSIWTLASSSKKDKGPANLDIDDVVLLLGVDDVKATKKFYVEQGLKVGKSFGGKYVEFESSAPIKFGLNSRKLLAKNAGVDIEGSGEHGIAIVGDIGSFTDPDGFVWESASR